MTDLEKATFLGNNIECNIHFYHAGKGDLMAKVVSVNPRARTFTCMHSESPLQISFDDVIEFSFRSSGIPINLELVPRR